MKGGKKVEEETKKPCTPVEEAGRDYNELGLYLHSKENNRTLEAAQTLWEFLPGWMAARKMAVNEEGLLQELPYNEHATDLYAFNYMSSIVGPAVLMAARGDELIGFAKSVAESICTEWKIPLEALGEGERFQTFNPD